MSYTVFQQGEIGTVDHTLYFKSGNKLISPFHDIPLWANDGVANMIVEIPKGSNAKMEINKELPFNPIKQDTKNGKLRYVAYPYPFNYGAFGQTWENPNVVDKDTKCRGDQDPIDVCEIGELVGTIGGIKQVKILGVWGMIDEGETDWKILAIDVNDPLATKYSDIDDIDPNKIRSCFKFLRDYKIPDGKPPNKFAFDGALKNREFVLKIINSCYEEWRALITGKVQAKTDDYNISVINTTHNHFGADD